MTPEQTKLFDDALLRTLDARRTRFGENVNGLAFGMVEFGINAASHELILDRLQYLTSKQLVEEVAKEVHRANRAWRITEAGIDYLDNHA